MLDENNALVKVFRMARDRYTECNIVDVRLRLINCLTNRSSQYNLPTASEVFFLKKNKQTHKGGYCLRRGSNIKAHHNSTQKPW